MIAWIIHSTTAVAVHWRLHHHRGDSKLVKLEATMRKGVWMKQKMKHPNHWVVAQHFVTGMNSGHSIEEALARSPFVDHNNPNRWLNWGGYSRIGAEWEGVHFRIDVDGTESLVFIKVPGDWDLLTSIKSPKHSPQESQFRYPPFVEPLCSDERWSRISVFVEVFWKIMSYMNVILTFYKQNLQNYIHPQGILIHCKLSEYHFDLQFPFLFENLRMAWILWSAHPSEKIVEGVITLQGTPWSMRVVGEYPQLQQVV